MIISYRHSFIFVKTRKTAGTTVEYALAPICGPADVITPIAWDQELERGGGQPLCRNFAGDAQVEDRYRAAILAGEAGASDRTALRERFHRTGFFNHMKAGEIRRKVAPEFWERAFKFTIERHPYEKAVSFAYFKYAKADKSVSFEAHLDEVVGTNAYRGSPFYMEKGRVLLDGFIRQENLVEDLRGLGRRLGVPIPEELLSAKTSRRADRRPAAEILSAAQRETVYRTCADEFELFGHEP